MARVTLDFPPEFASDAVAVAIEDTAIRAMDEQLEIEIGEIRDEAPVDLSTLKRELHVEPTRREGGSLVAYIVAAGSANAYAAVMDLGRTPGRAVPPISRIKAWVLRKMPERVTEVAQELQLQYQTDHPGRLARLRRDASGEFRKSHASRAVAAFEDSAAFLLARAIARSIAVKGIEGRRFVDGKKEAIEERVRAHVQGELELAMSQMFGGSL